MRKHLVFLDLNDLRKIKEELIDDVLKSTQKEDEVRFLTRTQTAKFLSISLSTVDAWSRLGKIKKRYLDGSARFDKEELVNLVRRV